MVFTKLSLESALTIRPCNYEATFELHLPKVARCSLITARVLKRSGLSLSLVSIKPITTTTTTNFESKQSD